MTTPALLISTSVARPPEREARIPRAPWLWDPSLRLFRAGAPARPGWGGGGGGGGAGPNLSLLPRGQDPAARRVRAARDVIKLRSPQGGTRARQRGRRTRLAGGETKLREEAAALAAAGPGLVAAAATAA